MPVVHEYTSKRFSKCLSFNGREYVCLVFDLPCPSPHITYTQRAIRLLTTIDDDNDEHTHAVWSRYSMVHIVCYIV